MGSEETVRGLATLRRELHPVMAGVVKECTTLARDAARARAPVRTGTLVDAIQMTYFDDGHTGVVFVAPRDDPGYSGGWHKPGKSGFMTAGTRRRPAQFPLWIEYGTVKMRSRPFLLPSFRGIVGQFESRARTVLARLVDEAS